MDRGPVVIQESTLEWETWPDQESEIKSFIYWKTLVSGDLTHSETLTLGIARIPSGEALHAHRHQQAETYLILEGSGLVRLDG